MSNANKQFSDWDKPANINTQKPVSSHSPIFLDSPAYSISTYLKLAYIKESLYLTRIYSFLILASSVPYYRYLMKLRTTLTFYFRGPSYADYISEYVIYAVALLSLITFILATINHIKSFLYLILSFSSVLFLLVLTNVSSRFSSDVFMPSLILISIFSYSLFKFYLRYKLVLDHITFLYRFTGSDNCSIDYKNLINIIRNIYMSKYTFINHGYIDISPNTISDKMETALLNELIQLNILYNLDESQTKNIDFRKSIRNISFTSRLSFSFSCLTLIFYASVVIYMYYHYIPLIYLLSLSLFISFVILFRLFIYKNDLVLHYFILYALISYTFILLFSIIFQVSSSNITPYCHYITMLLIFSLLVSLVLTIRSLIFLKLFKSAIQHLKSINIKTDHQSIDALRAMFFILYGYQKYFEHFEEDGWQ